MDDTRTVISQDDLLAMTVKIVSSYASGNAFSAAELPNVIASVHQSLAGTMSAPEVKEEKLAPAVPIKKSVTPDYIVCLEDGKHLKMLKRHLRTTYDMTPEEYRVKWGLPSNYPMVAPNYAKQRSEFAKKIGLGRAPAASKPTGRRKKTAA